MWGVPSVTKNGGWWWKRCRKPRKVHDNYSLLLYLWSTEVRMWQCAFHCFEIKNMLFLIPRCPLRNAYASFVSIFHDETNFYTLKCFEYMSNKKLYKNFSKHAWKDEFLPLLFMVHKISKYQWQGKCQEKRRQCIILRYKLLIIKVQCICNVYMHKMIKNTLVWNLDLWFCYGGDNVQKKTVSPICPTPGHLVFL